MKWFKTKIAQGHTFLLRRIFAVHRVKREASLYTKSFNLDCALKAEYCQHLFKVIGDKKGGRTSQILTNPDKVTILEDIRQVVQVPLKFIHVFRNPFDNIATMLLWLDGSRNKVRGEEVEKVRGGKGGKQRGRARVKKEGGERERERERDTGRQPANVVASRG